MAEQRRSEGPQSGPKRDDIKRSSTGSEFPPSNPDGAQGQASTSLSGRITASALQLAIGIVGPSSASVLPSALGSSETLASKGQAFSNSLRGPSTWEETRPAAGFTSSCTGSAYLQERFRSPVKPNGISRDVNVGGHSALVDVHYEQFMEENDGRQTSNHKSSAPNSFPRQFGGQMGTLPLDPRWPTESCFAPNSSRIPRHPAISLREDAVYPGVATSIRGFTPPMDGAEVVTLLDKPWSTMVPEIPELEPQMESSVDDLFAQNFSAFENRLVDLIKSQLPSPPIHRSISPTNPLNLRPHPEAFAEMAHNSYRDSSSEYNAGTDIESMSATNGEECYAYFSSQEHHLDWLSQWSDVLNRYTDDVWGDLLPAVKEARAVIHEANVRDEAPDTRATRRLKMILDHIETRLPVVEAQAGPRQPPTSLLLGKLTRGSGELQEAWDRASEVADALPYKDSRLVRQSTRPRQTGDLPFTSQNPIPDDFHRISASQLNHTTQLQMYNQLADHYYYNHSECLRQQGVHRAFLDKMAYEVYVRMQESQGDTAKGIQQLQEGFQSNKISETSGMLREKVLERDQEDGGEEGIEEVAIDPFYCPFPQCHEKLYSASQFKIHRRTSHNHNVWTVAAASIPSGLRNSDPQPYTCAHVGCGSEFSHLKEWATHIKQGHHDLLNPTPAPPREEEGERVPSSSDERDTSNVLSTE